MRAKTHVAAILWLATILMLAVLPAVAELVPLTGAIWTTTGQGEKVNANHYDQKCPSDLPYPDYCVSPPLVPFLNGGPSFASPRKWVPNGMYYFQVTDPSGKTLLSSDDIESRRFRVYDTDGVKHIEYPVPGYPSPDPFHLTCNDFESGNITIALCPFDDTPNNGGVYKLWITPVEAYEQYGDFVGRYSKTDNFKVKKLASVWGRKVDTDDAPMEDVCIILYKEQKVRGTTSWVEIDRTCTNGLGHFGFTGLSEGNYKVEEDLLCTECGGNFDGCTQISPPGPIYFPITKGDLGTRGKNSTPGEPIYIGEFVNECDGDLFATLEGRKFLDVDGDGCLDSTETPLEGWTICLEKKDGNGYWVPVLDQDQNPVCVTTGSDGEYSFAGLEVPMTYRICESGPDGYLQTGPNTGPDEECIWPPPVYTDPCSDIGVVPTEAGPDVAICAKDGCYIINLSEGAAEETVVRNLNFGNKLAELCVEKRDACTNALLPGFEFTLYDCACETPVTQDGLGNTIIPIVTGGDDDCWDNLLGGSYCVKETARPGWISVGPAQQCVSLDAGGTATVTFYNWAPCMGLTPGYWKNWGNHYTEAQFETLLEGTIAATIAEADLIFEHWDASPGDELTILKAFLLADQLTLNLTQLPGMPNPSQGSLVPECSLDYNGTPIVLSEVIEAALCCVSPDGCSREDLLNIKNWLAAFAEARMSTCPCIP